MFNKDFYPTPRNIIERMIQGEDLAGKHVLDPSAGKGDIVNYLNDLGANVSSCEINNDLARLSSINSKFLKPDFMDVKSHEISHMNFIYMNPPFSKDEQHINHAWEIAPDGCIVVALCNYETFKNSFSRNRSILKKTIEQYGSIENLGDCFSDAERETNVEIGLIRLYKPNSNDEFLDYFESEDDEVEIQQNGLMPYNVVRDVVERYVHACKLYDDVAENAVQMNSLISPFGRGSIAFMCTDEEKESKIMDFKIELKKNCWNWIFAKMNMDKYLTEKLKKEMNKFIETQRTVPFTMKNIYKMIEMVVATNGNRMKKVVVEVFEEITRYTHENRYGLEGWKTNSHYILNKKFIINNIANVSFHGNLEITYDGRATNMINDLNKAICFLKGIDYATIGSIYQHFQSRRETDENGDKITVGYSFGTWYDFGFFEVKFYKKGTMHSKFKDVKVWELFNREVAKVKEFELPSKF